MIRINYKRTFIIIILFVVLSILPKILGNYEIRVINQIACFSLFALSFNILFGHAGLLSFGQAAYFGLGAYISALVLKYIECSLPIAIFFGGLAGGIGAFIIGIFCVRLTGAYFALLTLAFSQFLFAIALKWRQLTGGDDGMAISRMPFKLPVIGYIETTNIDNIYYLIIIVVLICFFACRHLSKTPFWNAVKCVKLNEERANFVGYNPFITKIIIFSIAGLFAGFGGSLFVINEKFVSTDVTDIHRSIMCLIMAFIGGTNSLFGAVLGAAIYTFLTDWLSGYTAYWELILGCIFIVIILYFRGGFISLFSIGKTLIMRLKD